ncbi:DUF4349 domain-containing protein [Myxococcota bacterium]|nr:DUF4349 domain-containing protein [Myxococcota bacterium]MBU1432820.1 DUF4349 domain-containing protein [Myxococcota bacterium]MBU1897554.1 DUF4349 domain-containing protein [Myxococcota bacterium]
MRSLILSCALALSLGCGGSSPSYRMADGAYAPQEAPAPGFAAREAVVTRPSDDGGYDFEEDAVEGELLTADAAPMAASARPAPPAPSKVSGGSFNRSAPPPPPPKKESTDQTEPRAKAPQGQEVASDPMVVYTGQLNLRVRRPLETMDQITLWVEAKKGYIQSLTDQVIVVRVPSNEFEASIKHFATLGEVLDRQIQALDVSGKYTDISARLAVSRQARDRLLVLLEQTKDVNERLRVLQEIKRLSEQIESMESILQTLKKLADFSTITVALTPMVVNTQARFHRSPFPWVRQLEAHRVTLKEGKGKVALDLPKGFVTFEKEDYYRAQAADTTLIRVGAVANEPLGDARFWADAVRYEMNGRDEEHLKDGTAAGLAWHLFRSKTLRPRYYLIGVQAQGEQLFVLEVFFPDEAAWEKHGAAVTSALNSFKVK